MKAAYSPDGIAIRNGQDVQVTLSARGVFVPHIASGQMVGQPETAPLPSGLLVIVRHERERLRGRVVRNCLTDEGRPPRNRLQEQVPNHLRRLWSKAMVVSAEGKGLAMTRSGIRQEEDCKGTTVEVSKAMRRCQNRGWITAAGQSSDET
jgi:hypothetical protein